MKLHLLESDIKYKYITDRKEIGEVGSTNQFSATDV